MRHRRSALIVGLFVAALAVVPTLAGIASSQEVSQWTSSKTADVIHLQPKATPLPPQPPKLGLLTNTALQPYAAFATAVVEYQLQTAADAYASAAASQRAAQMQRAQSTVGSNTTPTQGSSSAEAPGAIWACIIQHESGGDPTAYNGSSGAAGLYQFELGTWLSSSIIAITGGYPGGASTAPASVQTAAAESYQAQNGWGAWRGDGCTPLG
jgi:hypothetical protein